MLTNPFQEFGKGFDVFMTDKIKITRANGSVNCTLNCCLFDGGIDEVISDFGTATTRKLIQVTIRKHPSYSDVPYDNDTISMCWPYVDTEPKIGDTITVDNGQEFKVYDVGVYDQQVYNIKARSV